MAPTLASIAAPAPVAAPIAAVSARKENAKEKAAIDKGLAEVRVERIRVDGLVSLVSSLLLRVGRRLRWREGARDELTSTATRIFASREHTCAMRA